MNTFGKRLVAIREKRGYSQKELAEKLGITPTRLNYWEKDKREPNIAMIKAISTALSVDSDYLIGNWAPDLYEDFSHLKTDSQRLAFFEEYGAPPEYSGMYDVLRGSSQFEPTEEEVYLITKFREADKKIQDAIWLLLDVEKNVSPEPGDTSQAG